MTPDERQKKKSELTPEEAKEVLKAIEDVEREEADQQSGNATNDAQPK